MLASGFEQNSLMANFRHHSERRPRDFPWTAVAVAAILAPLLVVGGFARAGQNDGSSFRRIDGSQNNPSQPDWGRANSQLLRLTTPSYADGVGQPSGSERPDARRISNSIHRQTAPRPNGKGASDLLWQWGQFIDHDLVLTPGSDPAQPFDIPVPSGDPSYDPQGTGTAFLGFNRSRAFDTAPRQQGNLNTAFLDGSVLYGSDLLRSIALRALDDTGSLATSGRRNLPRNRLGFDNAPSAALEDFFLSGDIRANEQLGLTALHTIFLREHNRLVKRDGLLRKVWASLPGNEANDISDAELTGELRYQLARVLVGAEIQAITYREFLPLLLGKNALPPYQGYDPSVNPAISNVFATVAFRLGHTMVPSTIRRRRANGNPIGKGDIELREAFFAPHRLKEGGIAAVLRGLASGVCEDIDSAIVEDLRSFLFGAPGAGGLDLAALNIQRGRDHGLPSYNGLRRDLGLPAAATFAEINTDENTRSALSSVYDSVEDVDAWVGLISESHHSGAMVGETTAAVLTDQFSRTRDGDRLWYELTLSGRARRFVEKRSLAKLIQVHTPIGEEIGSDAFRVGD